MHVQGITLMVCIIRCSIACIVRSTIAIVSGLLEASTPWPSTTGLVRRIDISSPRLLASLVGSWVFNNQDVRGEKYSNSNPLHVSTRTHTTRKKTSAFQVPFTPVLSRPDCLLLPVFFLSCPPPCFTLLSFLLFFPLLPLVVLFIFRSFALSPLCCRASKFLFLF
jgi:hypothetical protein